MRKSPVKMAVAVVAHPIKTLANKVHDLTGLPTGTAHTFIHYTVCISIVGGGAYLAVHVPPFVPHALHFAWDGFAYSIHGLGLAPIAERFLMYFSIDEAVKKEDKPNE